MKNRDYADGMEQLHSRLKKFDNVILSEEAIWRTSTYGNDQLFQELAADAESYHYRIKAIVYLRRQDQFLMSLWNQAVKRSSAARTATLQEYMEHFLQQEPLRFDYACKLDQIAAVLGKENLIVRRFEPSAWKDGSILADFLDCLGLELTDDFIPLQNNFNPSLKGNTCEIKRLINKNEAFSVQDRAYLGKTLHLMSEESGARYPCSMLSVEETRDFLKNFEEGNARVARDYIGDGNPLFSSEIKNLPKWEPDNPYMTEDLICFFSMIAVDLHKASTALQEENEELRKELNKLNGNIGTLKDKLKHPSRTLLNMLSRR